MSNFDMSSSNSSENQILSVLIHLSSLQAGAMGLPVTCLAYCPSITGFTSLAPLLHLKHRWKHQFCDT
ncbi:unnamed protein product [Calypogeia fissa]